MERAEHGILEVDVLGAFDRYAILAIIFDHRRGGVKRLTEVAQDVAFVLLQDSDHVYDLIPIPVTRGNAVNGTDPGGCGRPKSTLPYF